MKIVSRATWLALALSAALASSSAAQVARLPAGFAIRPQTPALAAAPAVAPALAPNAAAAPAPIAAAQVGARLERTWSVAERLATMPRGWDRDTFITMIPGPVFAHLSGAETAAVLNLVHWPGAYEAVAAQGTRSVAAEAWSRMNAADVATVIAAWDGENFNKKYHEGSIKAAIVRSWIAAHPEDTHVLPELLRRIPQGWDRDRLLTTIPETAYARMDASDRAVILSLLDASGDYRNRETSPGRRVSAGAARHLSRDVQAFVARWGVAGPNS